MFKHLFAVRAALCASFLSLPTFSASAQASDLHLICQGVGDHQVVTGSSATIFGRHGLRATGFGTSTSESQFEDEMDVELVGGAARARVPRRFLPPAHGGEGGWFEVKDLVVADDQITGTVLINFAQHPKLRIDRRSGSVALDGKVGSFAGQCHAFDPAASTRAF